MRVVFLQIVESHIAILADLFGVQFFPFQLQLIFSHFDLLQLQQATATTIAHPLQNTICAENVATGRANLFFPEYVELLKAQRTRLCRLFILDLLLGHLPLISGALHHIYAGLIYINKLKR